MTTIEVDPFLKREIKEIILEHPYDVERQVNEIMEKMTEFINENYVQKK